MNASSSQFEPIPHPPSRPIVGNLFELLGGTPAQNLTALAREYGPIFGIRVFNQQVVVVSNYELVNEISDETRFGKQIKGPQAQLRPIVKDGLFTAHSDEPNWQKAHNVLVSGFSMKYMQNYFPLMFDLASQLVIKWSRLRPNTEISVPEDMTRLALDTIGLCGFDYRFNSFYDEIMHPFLQSLGNILEEVLKRSYRLPIQTKLSPRVEQQFQKDIGYMHNLVDEIIVERKHNEQALLKKDFLNLMMHGKDKQTQEKLTDENMRYQILTFLVAGHETTSATLSFAIYYLLNNPAVLARAYEEVDRVLGTDPEIKPNYKQVNQLKYITQILKETLRLQPPFPIRVTPHEDTVIGGRYQVAKGTSVLALLYLLHRDETIWGTDVETFNPDRFLPEAERARPSNAYKPFGNGKRACIGRHFAMVEATLALGMILQRFELIDHTNYQLKVKETPAAKPFDFKIKISPREIEQPAIAIQTGPAAQETQPAPDTTPAPTAKHDTPLLVLYGSNVGSSEDFAHQITETAKMRGFATTIAPLDDYIDAIPKEGVVALVASTYNGKPPDNASKFHAWLANQDPASAPLQGVTYTVFGCGNSSWQTYQQFPRWLDQRFSELGAASCYARGEANAEDDFFGAFEAWDQGLWAALAQKFSLSMAAETEKSDLYQVEFIDQAPANPFIRAFAAHPMTIAKNIELQQKGSPRSTRHIEVTLPAGISYQVGDHLGVIPRNSETLVQRVAARFNLPLDATIRLRKAGEGRAHLPLDEPLPLAVLLSEHVELQEAATRKQVRLLLNYTENPAEKMKLLGLTSEDESSQQLYLQYVLEKNRSLLDLLEEFPSCQLPFHIYLEQLPSLRPRYYSISSSSHHDATTCSITVGVVNAPAHSGNGTYKGTCSNYLSNSKAGETIHAFIQEPKSNFRLPENPQTPVIMIGPGTGLAPFRGFLQARAAIQSQGQKIGPAWLFFGCRHPEQDFIYQDELEAFAKQGVVTLETAFSRVEGLPKTYVQDRIKANQDTIWQLIETGAAIYICGDGSRMAPAVRAIFIALYQEKTGKNETEANQWMADLVNTGRYLEDVWAAN